MMSPTADIVILLLAVFDLFFLQKIFVEIKKSVNKNIINKIRFFIIIASYLFRMALFK